MFLAQGRVKSVHKRVQIKCQEDLAKLETTLSQRQEDGEMCAANRI